MKSGCWGMVAAVVLGALSASARDAAQMAFQERVRSYDQTKTNLAPNQRLYQAATLAVESTRVDEIEDGLRLSEEAVALWKLAVDNGEPWTDNAASRLSLLDARGILERALNEGGRIGAGWQSLRETVGVWRDFNGLEAPQGSAIQPKEIPGLPPKFRTYGWRMIEREASYLHRNGRTTEAMALLDEALVQARADLTPGSTTGASFYATKLLSLKASILDFTGYENLAVPVFDRLIQIEQASPRGDSRLANAQINRLLAVSGWEGVTEKIVLQAREIVAQEKIRSGRDDPGMQRVLTNLESSLKRSREDVEKLKDAARKQQETGLTLEAFLSDRDALLAEADLGASGLDDRFNGFLQKAFEQGNRRSEPRIFREYGNYLIGQKRPAEAVIAYREGLARVQQFGWISWEPVLRVNLASALWLSGDAKGAERTLAELEAWYALKRDVSAQRKVAAERLRMNLLLAMGQIEKARKVLESARTLAGVAGLSDLRKEMLSAEVVEPLFLAASKPAATIVAGEGSADLMPKAIRTQTITGEAATTRFYVIQQGTGTQRGKIVVKGPGAALVTPQPEKGAAFGFVPGQPEAIVELAAEIPAGMKMSIDLTTAASDKALDPSITWQPESGAAATAHWEVSWGQAWSETLVLDAARVKASPFHAVPVLHTVRLPSVADKAQSVGFRLVSPAPLRIEYREPGSGQVLAVDWNGNGDFTEKGDLYPADAVANGLPAAAILAAPAKAVEVPVEVWISGGGKDAAIPTETVEVIVEIHDGTEWKGAAADVVEPAVK